MVEEGEDELEEKEEEGGGGVEGAEEGAEDGAVDEEGEDGGEEAEEEAGEREEDEELTATTTEGGRGAWLFFAGIATGTGALTSWAVFLEGRRAIGPVAGSEDDEGGGGGERMDVLAPVATPVVAPVAPVVEDVDDLLVLALRSEMLRWKGVSFLSG